MSIVVLYTLDIKIRRILRGLAAEFAYLAIIGSSVIPPRSLLRRRLIKVIPPELFSYLVVRIAGDNLNVFTNSILGIRLGGIPKCDLLTEVLPELYQLCLALKKNGHEPIYKVARDVIIPLAVVASVAGYEEGDILLTSYRAVSVRRDRDIFTVMRYFKKWYIIARF